MKWIRKIHLWGSVIVGLQLLIWLATGLYFNVMDHQKASGNQYRVTIDSSKVFDYSRLKSPKQIIANAKPVTSVTLIWLMDKPYYLANHKKGLYPHFSNRYSLFDAYTGEVNLIDQAFAQRLAMASYNGPGQVASINYISGSPKELPKQQNSSWQINFDDEVNTSVYIEAGSGRVIGHSDDDKRLADFFFMLHFMDYQQAGSFNNAIIMSFAFVTLWLTISGIIWVIHLIGRGQYRLRLTRK